MYNFIENNWKVITVIISIIAALAAIINAKEKIYEIIIKIINIMDQIMKRLIKKLAKKVYPFDIEKIQFQTEQLNVYNTNGSRSLEYKLYISNFNLGDIKISNIETEYRCFGDVININTPIDIVIAYKKVEKQIYVPLQDFQIYNYKKYMSPSKNNKNCYYSQNNIVVKYNFEIEYMGIRIEEKQTKQINVSGFLEETNTN